MLRYLFISLVVLFVSCEPSSEESTELLNLVPSETAVILKNNGFTELQNQFENLKLIQNNADLPLVKFLTASFSDFQHFQIDGENLAFLKQIGSQTLTFTVIAKKDEVESKLENISNKKVESFKYDSFSIKRYTIDGQRTFSTEIKDAVVMSTSKIILENIIRISKNELKTSPELKNITSASGSGASLLINHKISKPLLHKYIPNADFNFFGNFSDWTVLDLTLDDQDLIFTGVSQSSSDKMKTIDLFTDIEPNKNKIARVTPRNSNGFYSFTYTDFKTLKHNYREFSKPINLTEDWETIFKNSSEVGTIFTESGELTAIHSREKSKVKKRLNTLASPAQDYRDKAIFKLEKAVSFGEFFPDLMPSSQSVYFIELDQFFVFSHKVKALENCIANYKNKTVFADQKDYDQLKENLSDESSVLMVSQNQFFKKKFANLVSEDHRKAYRQTNVKGYPSSALQIIKDDGFAHINAVINSSKNLKQGDGTFQAASIQFPEELQAAPQYFENWRNHHQFIAAQGQSNTLYFYNYKGELIWKKDLNGPILGDIQELDIYGNKRIQMIFATPHRVHLIDKTGKEVDPFPVDFDDQITREVAVFDYNQNHKFRFVVTQGKKLFMFDKHGKTVDGFEFKGADSKIIHPPKHMRVYGKDFILVPEENGHLNILNRRGHQRVAVKEQIKPSGNPWFLYKNKFTSTTEDGQLLQIDQGGKVTTKDVGLGETHSFTATEENWAAISENKLNINGETVELDYGLYTEPQIIKTQQGVYIGLTDTQASKAYLFSTKAALWSGFPVYGNSAVNLNNMDNVGHLELLVKGEKDRILIYQVD